ncbi:MAG TPA: hypothetical protein VN924_04585 [Bryobacteraceae bacterium]|nr:hypothetical protein [Bryobacteraceae bacterium]
MSVILVQPYCECKRQDCLLRNLDSDGECAITLKLPDEQWAALLRKYNSSVYVTSPDCSKKIEPGFELIEKCDGYWIYGPIPTDGAPALNITVTAN